MNDESTIRTAAARGAGSSLLAAVGAALAASLCCLGPLLLVSLGASGAWIGSLGAFAPYRALFMAISAGFLGFAFFRVYRAESAEACEPGSACARPAAKRAAKVSLWLVTLLAFGLLGSPYVIARFETAAKGATPVVVSAAVEAAPLVVSTAVETVPVAMETATLSVEGMTCVSCIAAVERSLIRLDGVVAARVSFDPPRAVVEFDSAKLSPKDLAKATAALGYPSQVVD